MKKVKMINFNESGFIGVSTSNVIECNPYVLYDYEFYVIYTTLIQIYMKTVKMTHFNESGFIGLST